MKLLNEISEMSLGLGDSEKIGGQYELRKSARAILLNNKGEMATQYLRTYTYHKLPGGGVDQGETVEEALKREVLEEVGCNCEITKPIGVVIEYRNLHNLIHISFAFVANLVGAIGGPQLEDGEIEEGQETLWLPPSEVLAKMETDTPSEFIGHFILEREKSFLKEYLSGQM